MSGVERAAERVDYARQVILTGLDSTRMAKKDVRSATRILSGIAVQSEANALYKFLIEYLDLPAWPSPEASYEIVKNSMSDVAIGCANALEAFDELVGDTESQKAQDVRLFGGIARRQCKGEVEVGDTNLPATVESIGEDVRLITDRVGTAMTLGSEILQELGLLDKVLASLGESQHDAAEGMKQVLREL